MAVSSEPASFPAPGDRLCDRYLVLEVIGQGGMGRVLAARNEATGKRVALKHLREPGPDAAARFAREARAAGRVHHPNVVDVYDVLHHEGTTYLVMELLRGEPLSSALAREPRLSIEETVSIGLQVARGVEAAHREGVIHRDLKPANIFLCQREPETLVKILDFGISKIIDPGMDGGVDGGVDDIATRSDVVLGTPHYLSPEQVRGSGLDARVDVYALGALLYTMLTGRPPHDHSHIPALLVEIATAAPAPVEQLRPDVPTALSEVVHRALVKEPSARFQTAEHLAEALRGVLRAPSGRAGTGAVCALDVPTVPVALRAASDAGALGPVEVPVEVPVQVPVQVQVAHEPIQATHAPTESPRRRRGWALAAAAGLLLMGLLVASMASPAPRDAQVERAAARRVEPPRAGPEAPPSSPSAPPRAEAPSPEEDPHAVTPAPHASRRAPPRAHEAPRAAPRETSSAPISSAPISSAPVSSAPISSDETAAETDAPRSARHRAGRLALDDF